MVSRTHGAGSTSPPGRVVHAHVPIDRSPSGLPIQYLVSERNGAVSLFVGQQSLQPGEQILLHQHPVEEVLTFLTGQGEAIVGSEQYMVEAGMSVHVPAGVPHGFANTGVEDLHLLVIFPLPYFAPTELLEGGNAGDAAPKRSS